MKRVWTTLKWTAARTVLRTVGRAGRGIRIGYRFGFDSGVMLDHVYENRARGVLGVGLPSTASSWTPSAGGRSGPAVSC